MKKSHKNILLFFAVLLFTLSSCSSSNSKIPKDSILHEFDLSSENISLKGLSEGMTVEEVLNTLNLSEDEVLIDSRTANYVTPGVNYTQVETIDPYYFSESMNLPLKKVFLFPEGTLQSMTYYSNSMEMDMDEFYNASMEFIDNFIKNCGAVPVENAEGFEYRIYGTEDRADFASPGASKHVEFFNGGVLREISTGSQDVSMTDKIPGDILMGFAIDIDFR